MPSPAVALIVGASHGIGLGFVEQLWSASQIAHLYATYRHPETAAALFHLRDRDPERLTCLPLDITEEAQIAAIASQIQATTDKLHLIVNCVGLLHAGDLQPEKSVRHLNAAQLTRYFQVNSIGAVLLAKYLLPLLNHQERSLFATISAKVGSIGDNHLGGWYGYRASKAALNMLMHTVAIEYRRKSPQTIVLLLHPGTTNTPLSQPFQKNVPPEKLFSVERTVTQLLTVLRDRDLADSGQFFAWDGSPLPW